MVRLHRIKTFRLFLKQSFIDVFSSNRNGESRIDLIKENWGDMKTQNYFQEDPEAIKTTEALQKIANAK